MRQYTAYVYKSVSNVHIELVVVFGWQHPGQISRIGWSFQFLSLHKNSMGVLQCHPIEESEPRSHLLVEICVLCTLFRRLLHMHILSGSNLALSTIFACKYFDLSAWM